MSVLKQKIAIFFRNLQKALLDANQSNVKYLSGGGTNENRMKLLSSQMIALTPLSNEHINLHYIS